MNRAVARRAEIKYRDKNRELLNAKRRVQYSANIAREKASWKLYAAANVEVLRAYWRAKSHARRVGGIDTKGTRAAMEETLDLARVGNVYLDAYDGTLIERPTIDHIIPVASGGLNLASNFCITSFANNRSKSDTPLIVWMARRAADQRLKFEVSGASNMGRRAPSERGRQARVTPFNSSIPTGRPQ